MVSRDLRKMLYIAGALCLLVTPSIVRNIYVMHAIDTALVTALVVLGLNYITGLAGQVCLGMAGFYAIGAYVTALATKAGYSFWIVLPVAAGVAGLFGLVLGFPSLRVRGPYLAISTVGFTILINLVLVNWVEVTRGPSGIVGIPDVRLGRFVLSGPAQYFYLCLLFLVLGTIVGNRIESSRVGRAFKAIREDELAAAAMGINVARTKLEGFVIAAVYAGVAGSLHSVLFHYISPDNFTRDESIKFLSMLIIGGLGSAPGAALGGILLTLLPEWLRFMKELYLAVYGVLVMVFVVFMPGGLASLIRRMAGILLPKGFSEDHNRPQ